MKKKQALAFFLASLVSAAIFVVLVKKIKVEKSNSEISTILDSTALGKVDKLALKNSENEIVLVKTEDSSWVIENGEGLEGDASRIYRFIDDLSSSKIERTVSSSADKNSEYGFGLSSVKVLIEEGGRLIRELHLGETRSGGGQYIKLDQQESIYLISKSVSSDLTKDYWAYKTLIEIPKSNVKGIWWSEAKNKSKTVSYVREKASDEFKISRSSGPIKEENFSRVLKALENLAFIKLKDRSDKETASSIEKSSKLIRVRLFDGRELNLTVGSQTSSLGGLLPIELQIGKSPQNETAIPESLIKENEKLAKLNAQYFFLFSEQIF